MTRASADRIRAVWTGAGTGTISLGGAAPGEAVQAFPASLDGKIIRYLIEHETAQEAESGYGLYTHSGATLSRLYHTSPGVGVGAVVAFSPGTKFVSPTSSSLDLVVDEATVDPTASDDVTNGFLIGHFRLNTVTKAVHICSSHAAGAATWERLDGAGVTIDQNDILARLVSGSGAGVGVAAADLTEELTPEAGDFVLGWAAGLSLRKFNIGNWSTTADAAPTLVSGSGTFVLASTARMHQNVIVTSTATNTIFQVPLSAAANSSWWIIPSHTGCTVTKEPGAGTISPSPARIILGGTVIPTVRSNAGSAPIVEVRGEVIVPSTVVTTKTYTADDHGQDFTASGNQTFSAATNYPDGFYTNIWATAAISIIGPDATHSCPINGAVTVKKRGDLRLVCNGSGTVGDTLLDAP